VTVSGSYAYVADGPTGLRVIDVSNPQNPVEVGSYDTPTAARGVAVSGSLVYVADDTTGLRVVDASNPQSPFEAGYYDTDGFASDVTVSGSFAYVADGDSGLQVYEFYGAGIEETMNDALSDRGLRGQRGTMNIGPTIVRGVLVLPEARGERRVAGHLGAQSSQSEARRE
jgi:hypothetical protein